MHGLDEAGAWSQKGHLLEKLMKGTPVIIKSRFFDTKMPRVSVDLNLEALGFAYLDNTADMVRVPIHLDILCYSWDELHGQNSATITAVSEGENDSQNVATLYQAIVRSLWRKDIPSLDKLGYAKEVTAEIVSAVWNVVWAMT